MSMVEILLHFIRAERECNWNLHLEAFAAMLPWLTIYDHTNYAKWGPVYLEEMKNLENTAPEVYAEFMNVVGILLLRDVSTKYQLIKLQSG